jgi:hypothetical protein
MDFFEEIKKERNKGVVHCGALGKAESATKLAAAFGLSDKPACYRGTDADMARSILIEILHRDLAYGTRLMPLSRAEALSEAFMQRYGKRGYRFFTNADFKRDAGAGLVLAGWNPATSATFDTGVLALGAPGAESACVWVADED